MGKMTIQDISKVLIERNGVSKKEAAAFVNAMFDIIQQALERDRIVKVKGFGTFKIIDVDARESVNVNTGERVLIEGHDKITFLPDSLMKELVNKPFSQFETVVLKDGVDFDDAEAEKTGEESDSGDAVPLVEFGDSINLKPVILGEEKPVEKPIEEPVPEPKAESLAEPVAASVEESVSEEVDNENSAEDVPVEEEIVDEEPVYAWEQESSDGKKWWIALVACLLGLIGGYLLGSYFPFSRFTSQNDIQLVYPDSVKVEKAVPPTEPKVPATEQAPADTTAVQVKAEEAEPVKAKPVETKPVQKVETQQQDAVVDKYSTMDVRVRTGAYKIVGTDRVVKAREGETLLKIARHTLGPDMECYLEVYNGLKASSPLKVGQEIKIPKLQLKKKKKPQTVNE